MMTIPASIASLNRAERVLKHKEARKFGRSAVIVASAVIGIACLTPFASGQQNCAYPPKQKPMTVTDYVDIGVSVALTVWRATR